MPRQMQEVTPQQRSGVPSRPGLPAYFEARHWGGGAGPHAHWLDLVTRVLLFRVPETCCFKLKCKV